MYRLLYSLQIASDLHVLNVHLYLLTHFHTLHIYLHTSLEMQGYHMDTTDSCSLALLEHILMLIACNV